MIDKDLASSLLARELKADALLMLTDVDAVYKQWGQADAQAIRHVASSVIREYTFARGSMAPKVEAACEYVEQTNGFAGIGALKDAAAILDGEAGTLIKTD